MAKVAALVVSLALAALLWGGAQARALPRVTSMSIVQPSGTYWGFYSPCWPDTMHVVRLDPWSDTAPFLRVCTTSQR
jgi:hypothetical protein